MSTFLKKYSWLLPVLVFITLIFVGWGKWGNLIIDNYRDPWLALEILKGKVLYRDLDYLYGLLAPYLISWLFKIFGTQVHILYLLGISTGLSMALLEYKLLRFFFSRALSSVLLTFFIPLFLAGTQDATSFFNFIFPYTYSSTLCMCSLMTALYAYLRLLKKCSSPFRLLWSAGMSAAFLFRIDLSLIALTVFFMLEIYFRLLRNKKVLSVTLIVPILVSFIIYAAFIISHQAWAGFKDSILDYYLYIFKGQCYFNAETMGLHQLTGNIREILLSGLILALFALICRLSLYFFKIHYFFAGTSGIILCFAGLKLTPSLEWFRVIPALCFLIFFSFFIFSVFRKKIDPEQEPLITDQLLSLAFFSFAVSFRILLKAGPDNYGFFLLDPGLICFFIFLFRICPSWNEKFFALSDVLKARYILLMLILLSVLFFPWLQRTFLIYSIKTVPVATRFGTLYCEPIDRTENFLKAVEYLKKNTDPGSKVVVFPEGILINLLSERQHPLRYAEFLPHGIERFGEKRLIREMEAQGTDYIVLLNLQTTPYEFHYFGIDYAVKIMNWIWANYEQCALFGPMPFTDEGFGFVIFKRKNLNKANP